MKIKTDKAIMFPFVLSWCDTTALAGRASDISVLRSSSGPPLTAGWEGG